MQTRPNQGEKYRDAKYNTWSTLKIKRRGKTGHGCASYLLARARSTKQQGKQAHPRLFRIASLLFSSSSSSFPLPDKTWDIRGNGFDNPSLDLRYHSGDTNRYSNPVASDRVRANSLARHGTQFAEAIRATPAPGTAITALFFDFETSSLIPGRTWSNPTYSIFNPPGLSCTAGLLRIVAASSGSKAG